MSDFEYYVDYSLCDPSPLADEDLPFGTNFEPLQNSSEPFWLTGEESAGSTSNNDSFLGFNAFDSEPERQRSISLPPFDDPAVWINDLIRSSCFFAPLASEVVVDVPKPFDGQIPVNAYVNVLTPEDEDSNLTYNKSTRSGSSETSSTPVHRRVSPLLKPGKRQVSHEPKDGLVKKPKGRKTFNSACAADDMTLFLPNLALPIASSSSISSPLSESLDASSPSPKAVTTKKRKLEEIEDFEFSPAKEERKRQSVVSEWRPVTESYSQHKFHNQVQYRCDLCFKDGHEHLCSREGDIMRHLQSLRHKPRSFFCPNSRCSSSFTRQDALKRHMNKCKA